MRVINLARHVGWAIKNLVYLAIGKYKFDYGKYPLVEDASDRFLKLEYNRVYPVRVRNSSDTSQTHEGYISVDNKNPETYDINLFEGGSKTFRIDEIVELQYKCLVDSQGNIVSWKGS